MPANDSSPSAAMRSSHPWTQADSAAGFVMRYLSAMRGQLLESLGSDKLTDHALTLFIGHLVSKGYGPHGQGRLRDFLIRGIRSAAKVTVAKLPEAQRPAFEADSLDAESAAWLGYWRACILELAWRKLEQFQHKHPERLDYTALKAATENPAANLAILAVQMSAAAGVAVEQERVESLLKESRQQFAQILATEIANTLHMPSAKSIAAEMKALRLS